MCKITTIANQKGGTGKSTTTQILGLGLVNKGKRVLLIDMDPQMSLTEFSGIEYSISEEKNVRKMFQKALLPEECIVSSKFGYDIIPSTLLLSSANREFSNFKDEFILRNSLKGIKEKYDYIFIDTPPSLGILSLNALVCSNDVIIPITSSIASLRGFMQLYDTINELTEIHNPDIKIAGVLINMFRQTNSQKECEEALKTLTNNLNINVFNSKIRKATIVEASQSNEDNVLLVNNQKVVGDYNEFIREYLNIGEEE